MKRSRKGKKKVSFTAANRARKHARASAPSKPKGRNTRGPRLDPQKIDMGGEVDTAKVHFKPSPRQGTIYQPIIDRISKLKKNKSFTVKTPAGITSDVFHNRMNMALNRQRPKMGAGLTYRKGTDLEGNIVISAVPLKPAKKSAKKSKAPV